MSGLTRRTFVTGLGLAIAAPATLRTGLAPVRAQSNALVGDGLSNDLPTLRQMLAEAERRGKGVVRLPAGRFWLAPEKKGPALVLPANVRLEGAGIDRTTLIMADGAFGHVVSAPYGWVQIADLTIDGNEANRPGAGGHNIRVNGDHVLLERVRVINSIWYGIGVGQRRFARDVIIRDVDVINAGSDGIDVKNDLDRTENIIIINTKIQGFGRPLTSLPTNLIGSEEDVRRNKAGVDLRGKNCKIDGLHIFGVRPNRDGLRFRHGEKGDGHGAGAHGAIASNVVVRGIEVAPKSNAISVVARDVQLKDINVSITNIGVFVGAENLRITGGRISGSGGAAVYASKTRYGRPDRIGLIGLKFIDERRLILKDIDRIEIRRCQFTECRGEIKKELQQDRRVELTDCQFDESCL